MKHRIQKLGELYLSCSTHLFQNLAREGIAYWWDNKSTCPKGGVVFSYYDSSETCLRPMPKTPKFFDASIKSGLISPIDAALLGRELLMTIGVLLEGYSGFFSQELKTGPIGEGIRRASEPDDFGLHDAHHGLAPDDVYSALPWPLIPAVHFRNMKIVPAGIRSGYIADASQEALRAINMAADIVTFGPSFLDNAPQTILGVLDWLKSRHGARAVDSFLMQGSGDLQKIIVPSFTGGFQGIAFGLFRGLPTKLESFVTSQLQQFAATIGEHLAFHREQEHILALKRASSLTDYARAFISILPPVEHAVFIRGKEKAGVRLAREGAYLAGYRPLAGAELNEALVDQQNQKISSQGADIEIVIKMASDTDALSPVFTLLRLRPRIRSLPIKSNDGMATLTHTELGSLYHGLRRQIKEERGAIAASKKLFLIDLVLQHYHSGEVTLSNNMAREFTERTLGRSITGYHVAGKAAKKFEADIQKLAPKKFGFQAISTNVVKIKWKTGEAITMTGTAPSFEEIS